MKKIFNTLLLACLALGLTTSCSDDRDDNPTLGNTSLETFQLNTPATAFDNVYDLLNGSAIIFTASQPDYGFPVATDYSMEVSLDGENWMETASESLAGKITVDASALNTTLSELNANDDGAVYLSSQTEVKFRSIATVAGYAESGKTTSNVVSINVLPYDPTAAGAAPELPTTMYLCGSFPLSDSWNKFIPLAAAYAPEGLFYRVMYFNAGDEFKVIPKDGWGEDRGYGQIDEWNDNAEAGIESAGADASSNIKVTNAGWYTVCVRVKAKGESIVYSVTFRKPEVYLIGNLEGGNWTAAMSEWMFTVPSTADGEFVSPAFSGNGELRAYVDCGTDWWNTEFTFNTADGNSIWYRIENIANNWADDKGAEYSVTGAAGQKCVVNFNTNTGRIE